MVTQRTARCGPRGDAVIPPRRPPRLRLIPGALAIGSAAGIVALSIDTRSPGLVTVTGALGLVALLVLGAVLVLGRPGLIGGALGLLAILYLGHVYLTSGASIAELALASVALLLVGELSQWSIDGKLRGRYASRLHASRAAGIAGLALLGLVAVLASGLAAALPVSSGIGTLTVATGAAVALLALISTIALRRAGPAGGR